jgi:hypothetical protein
MNISKLHLTCFVLALPSPEQIQAASDCLRAFQPTMQELLSTSSKELTFRAVGNFTTKVLYTSPVPGVCLQLLDQAVSSLEASFRDAGLLSAAVEQKEWVPHCTILKTSYDRKNGRNLKIKPDAYEGCERWFRYPNGVIPSDIAVTTVLADAADGAKIALEGNDAAGASSDAPQEGVVVPLTTIDLLSMQEVQSDGYYRSYAHIVV